MRARNRRVVVALVIAFLVATAVAGMARAEPGVGQARSGSNRPLLTASGLGSPIASSSGTCDPINSPATANFGLISGDHQDVIERLVASGPAAFSDGDFVVDGDTASAGTVWDNYGVISAGTYASTYIDCGNATSNVSYTVELYDAPSTPAVISGAVTLDPSCADNGYGQPCSVNPIHFYAPATAHYVADLTLTQGSADLCCDAGGHDQVFASSGRFDLGYLNADQQVDLTPLDGPEVQWTLSIHALPVTMSGLSFDVPYIRPTQIATVSYSVDGDVSLSATIQNQSGQVLRTLASVLSVAAGPHALTWDGLDGSGSPVPDGSYTLKMSYTDAAGNSATDNASIEVDRTPPVVTVVSPSVLKTSSGLVIGVHDALTGLKSASLSVDGKHVQSLDATGTKFIYVPSGGWSPGSHIWSVAATDNAGNSRSASGTFTTAAEPVANCSRLRVKVRGFRSAYDIRVRHMTCTQADASIRRGRLHSHATSNGPGYPSMHWRFRTPGFTCAVVHGGEFPRFRCKRADKAFRFTYGG